MPKPTTELSFLLKATPHGVGVFAAHDIQAESYLRVFGDEDQSEHASTPRQAADVPEVFKQYFINDGEILIGPKDFGHMEIGWYLNHSHQPNAYHRDYQYYALRDIKAGEEITIDYNTLEEPEHAKEDYYKL